VTASYVSATWPAWSFPTTYFAFGQYDYTTGLSYYDNVTSIAAPPQVMFSLDFPGGIGLPEHMYNQYVTMLQNITSNNFNCSVNNATYPVGSNCISTTNEYGTTILESLNFFIYF